MSRSAAHSKGFSLIELMVSVAFMGIVMLVISSVLVYVTRVTVKARETSTAVNLSQQFFSRLNNIPFIYVFEMDSSSTNYRLNGTFGDVSTQQNPYPYLSTLNDFATLMRGYKFDRFTLDVRFVIRDLSDINNNGETTDLRYFTDVSSGANLIDDYDSALKYFDQNSDNDYYDVYGSPQVTEQPHTRMKEVTFKLYKSSQVIYQETQLVSWEKLTGVEGKAAGATLTLIVSTPSEGSAIYDIAQTSHSLSFSLVISTSYPSDVYAFRSDTSSFLTFAGETTPNATFSWRLGTPTGTITDACTADTYGDFSCTLTNIAKNLAEGSNTIWGQAYKTAYYSPWAGTSIIRDVSTPTVTMMVPTGTINNLQPVVRAKIQDNPHTTGRTVAGINSATIGLFKTSTTALTESYDSSTGYVTWIDTISMPPVLSTTTYTIILEGGDNAFYKVRSTWTFTISVSTMDYSAPIITNVSPSASATAASNFPTIMFTGYDNDTGIKLNDMTLTLDGSVVVSTTIGNLASAYSPLDNQSGFTLSYVPSDALASGAHTAIASVSHWGVLPSSNVTTTYNWSFLCP